MKPILVLALGCLWLTVSYAADERILMEATINDHPVHLIFDTGTSALVLLRPAAERLGLRITSASPDYHPGPGRVAVGVTEECNVTVLNKSFRTAFYVIQVPAYVAASRRASDGLLGWSSISNNIVLIEASTPAVFFLPGVPDDMATWLKFRLAANSDVLKLEIPNPGGTKALLTVDTGAYQGVMLNAQRWREWKAGHAGQPTTLDAYYTPAVGVVVREQALAGELSLGPLGFTNVLVTEADASDAALLEYQATLGFAALKQLDVMVDGKHGMAYLRPQKPPALPCDYNRLGAVFVPPGPRSDDLVAQVVKGSPAYEAGIRNGDRLLNIGEIDAAGWRTYPDVFFRQSWQRPAGTRLDLVLKRGRKIFKTTVILRDILSPSNAH